MPTIDIPGGIILAYVAKTANYTVGLLDSTIDGTANSFTVTLPTAVGVPGRTYIIKNSGTGVITVACFGGQLLDGLATASLVQGASITVQSNGVGWIII